MSKFTVLDTIWWVCSSTPRPERCTHISKCIPSKQCTIHGDLKQLLCKNHHLHIFFRSSTGMPVRKYYTSNFARLGYDLNMHVRSSTRNRCMACSEINLVISPVSATKHCISYWHACYFKLALHHGLIWDWLLNSPGFLYYKLNNTNIMSLSTIYFCFYSYLYLTHTDMVLDLFRQLLI